MRKTFNKAIAKIGRRPISDDGEVIKTLYHGTSRRLQVGEFLKCNTNFDSDTTKKLTGVFATSSIDKAKFFALIGCVRKNGRSRLSKDKKIYLENVREDILPNFYLYTVDSSDFHLDARDEYICNKDVKIQEVQVVSLVDEITKHGWKFYLTPQLDKSLSAQDQIKQMNEFVESGNFKPIDVAGIIQNNAKRIYNTELEK